MPFTVNVGPYQGGNFLMQGLTNAGEGIAKAIQANQEQDKTAAYNDMIVQHALNNGEINLEDFTKYKAMGHSAKTGFAASIAANFVEDLKREQMQGLREQRQAQAELRKQQAAAFGWKPDQSAIDAARWTGNELVQTGPGKFQPVPYGDTTGGDLGNPQIMPFNNPITGQPVPGFGIVRQPGGKQFQVVQFGSDEPVVQVDENGVPYLKGPKGVKVPLNVQQLGALRMQGVDIPGMRKPATAPADTGPSIPARIWNAIQSANPGATNRVREMNLGKPGATSTPAPAATAGDVRAAATAYLQQHGLPVTEANIQHYIDASQSQ